MQNMSLPQLFVGFPSLHLVWSFHLFSTHQSRFVKGQPLQAGKGTPIINRMYVFVCASIGDITVNFKPY